MIAPWHAPEWTLAAGDVAQLAELAGSAHRPRQCGLLPFHHEDEKSYVRAAFCPGDFLVFGRETKGLPESLLEEHPERCLTIPIANEQVRSLNLATAAAIVLFEALRQTGDLG